MSSFKPLLVLCLAVLTQMAEASPTIEHWTSPSGARVFFVETHSLPILDVELAFAAGSALDPQDKPGLAAATHTLLDLGVQAEHITQVSVPGALEVPLALMALAERDEFDALIALGCIIRGETYHFELVANESGAGVSRVGLDYGIPIANAILTTENLDQAVARQTEKGRDAAYVAVEMANLLGGLAA